MNLDAARTVAMQLRARLLPYCERLEVAGSIRRGRPEVKDIELVAIPRIGEVTLPGELLPTDASLLHCWAIAEAANHGVAWIKTGTEKAIPWPAKLDAKYLRALLPCSVVEEVGGERFLRGGTLDLFMATPDTWGCQFTIRTGSAEFSHALVTYAQRIGMKFEGGRLWRNGLALDTPEEADVFHALGLEYVSPGLRLGWESVRGLGASQPGASRR